VGDAQDILARPREVGDVEEVSQAAEVLALSGVEAGLSGEGEGAGGIGAVRVQAVLVGLVDGLLGP